MSEENLFENTEAKEISPDENTEQNAKIYEDADSPASQAKQDNTVFSESSEFERELEHYLPTNANTDKVKKSLPQWALSAISSAAVCIIFLLIYSIAVMPRLKPTAVISYVDKAGGTAQEDTVVISDISEKVLPSIVTVSSTASYRNFFGLSSSTNTGSGIIISPDGYILTSNSLVGDGSDVKISLPDKQEYTAKLLGSDAGKDIAILKIEASGLTAAVLGNSDNVRPGDTSIVIGNLLGKDLGMSVTKGIICGVNKSITLQNGSTINLLQTDAITNSQSAGGCVLNSSGEVIGMITYALSSNAENISLAIPSNDIKNISESLINTGSAPKGLIIGITGTDNEHGVTVESVMDDTPAQKAGIKSGDLILKVDNTAVKSISDINRIRDTHKKGDTIVLTIYRDGETIDINVVL